MGPNARSARRPRAAPGGGGRVADGDVGRPICLGLAHDGPELEHRRAHPRRSSARHHRPVRRSEEHTSELQSLMRISYAAFCLKKNTQTPTRRFKPTKLESL